MSIPEFPASIPISPESSEELQGILGSLTDGISEFSFAGLYLFRSRYNYRLSSSGGALLVFGENNGRSFFITPSTLPSEDVLNQLLQEYDEWKLISPSLFEKEKDFFAQIPAKGFSIVEDRDNFDYLYHRRDLAELPGKAFHKKKNHVNAFVKANKNIREETISAANVSAAREILSDWGANQRNLLSTDFKQANEALDAIAQGIFDLCGLLVFANDVPAAYCIAELFAQKTMATVHFEKARSDAPGAFQYINYAFARSLPEQVLFINREQDMGDEGLRQAKMTYRPCAFVKKYAARRT